MASFGGAGDWLLLLGRGELVVFGGAGGWLLLIVGD